MAAVARRYRNVSDAERREIRRRVDQGQRQAQIAREVGRAPSSVQMVIYQSGGYPPRPARQASTRNLCLEDREEIFAGLRGGESLSAIGRRIGRSASTISREVAGNGGVAHYRPGAAQARFVRGLARPKPGKLATHPALRAQVEQHLQRRWSPQQIARWLRRSYPDDPEMWVSHETIYQALFVQTKGVLRKELTGYLRSGKTRRGPASKASRAGKVTNKVMISARPAEVEDRAVPGHWEGDLIIGAYSRSAIATLVERSTRFVMLAHLPGDHSAPTVAAAVAAKVTELPHQLRRSLTWDQGTEMAQHLAFTTATDMPVYFCDPHSPWQRGTNENTNGLLRQYFPKGTDLSVHTENHLDAVAAELNDRPRQTLNWMKPSQKLAELLATIP